MILLFVQEIIEELRKLKLRKLKLRKKKKDVKFTDQCPDFWRSVS